MNNKVLIVLGTRPEAIKMMPVIKELRAAGILHHVINTGQHKEILDSVLSVFDVDPAQYLGLMEPNQSLADLTARAIQKLSKAFELHQPDLVLVHGDTTTAMAASLAAFYKGVAVGHVEAGLRTHDLNAPYPEELNRQLIARVSRFNFAPTALAKQNLLREGIPESRVIVTGNTAVDSVVAFNETWLSNDSWFEEKSREIQRNLFAKFGQAPFALVTLHRRENAGQAFQNILSAIEAAALAYPEFTFIFPVHPNPIIRDIVSNNLQDLKNIIISDPIDYLTFMTLSTYAAFLLSDSGGIQEEAVTLNKTVLVARSQTERPEGIDTGTLVMVGSDAAKIREKLVALIPGAEPAERPNLNLESNPYGDGTSAAQIVAKLIDRK